ncbi:MAG: DsrE family protein [Gammaproteobacteria bacterium]|nr:DsrE family protein [Gammaproteobacteria bacterium]
MRNWLVLLFSLLLVSGAGAEQIKVLLHLDQADQAVTLISVAEEIIKGNPDVDVQVVVHGAAVTRLRLDDYLNADFQRIVARGVHIGVCNVSMARKGLLHDSLLSGVELITEGGIARILALQKQGYSYVKI